MLQPAPRQCSQELANRLTTSLCSAQRNSLARWWLPVLSRTAPAPAPGIFPTDPETAAPTIKCPPNMTLQQPPVGTIVSYPAMLQQPAHLHYSHQPRRRHQLPGLHTPVATSAFLHASTPNQSFLWGVGRDVGTSHRTTGLSKRGLGSTPHTSPPKKKEEKDLLIMSTTVLLHKYR
jgi:hypothetical protein